MEPNMYDDGMTLDKFLSILDKAHIPCNVDMEAQIIAALAEYDEKNKTAVIPPLRNTLNWGRYRGKTIDNIKSFDSKYYEYLCGKGREYVPRHLHQHLTPVPAKCLRSYKFEQ